MLTVSRHEDLLTLDFPARPASTCDTPRELTEGLGARPNSTAKARDYLAVFDTEDAVQSLQPDMSVLKLLDCVGIIATAPGKGCDFVSRFFAPNLYPRLSRRLVWPFLAVIWRGVHVWS